MILLVEWQFPQVWAFLLRRFVNFWEIVQYAFRVEVEVTRKFDTHWEQL